jgi:hypothetical protein
MQNVVWKQVVLIVSNADVEISALLTPAQQQRFEKMMLKDRDSFNRWKKAGDKARANSI